MDYNLTRRQMIRLGTSFGIGLAGAALFDHGSSSNAADASQGNPWQYHELDTPTSEKLGYKGFYKGGCAYGTFYGAMFQLSRKHGEPYSSFPIHMMKFGTSGVAGYGSLCGCLNGGAALIGLFCQDDAVRNQMIQELLRWYEQTKFPIYKPSFSPIETEIVQTKSNSVLCHVSVGEWCGISGYKASSKERSDRCARLAGDVSKKTTDMLNSWLKGEYLSANLSSISDDCRACHGRGGEVDNIKGLMDCSICHDDKLSDHY